jgi:hypothetical protein
MTTPTDLIERHVAALIDVLKTDQPIAPFVFDGDVQGDPDLYVNVHHDTGYSESRTMLGEHQDVDVTFTLHSVGRTRWQATWTDGRVYALLNDRILTVPGRRCFKLAPAGTQPVQKDTSIPTSPRFIAVRRLTLHSIPAREA